MTDEADSALPLRIVAGSPTDEETAAIAALLSDLVAERAASSLPLPSPETPSVWSRTARSLRGPWPPAPDQSFH